LPTCSIISTIIIITVIIDVFIFLSTTFFIDLFIIFFGTRLLINRLFCQGGQRAVISANTSLSDAELGALESLASAAQPYRVALAAGSGPRSDLYAYAPAVRHVQSLPPAS
jgi:hypothetical protein